MIQYYIENQGKVVGPLSLQELKGKKVLPNTLVWRHGLENWTSAKDVEELKTVFSFGPPPLPASIAGIVESVPFDEPVKKIPELKKVISGTIPMYDEKYRKETEAAVTGIFLVITPVLFVIFYKMAFDQHEYYSYLKIISFGGAIVIRIVATFWVMQIARHQNRDANKWGLCSLVFPGISLVIIGTKKKLYDGKEWKKHLYQEPRKSSGSLFHTAVSERF